jgi:hypothetical protein
MSDLARVHAVLASGVEHPRLLEQWRQQPETLRDLGIEPETLDLAALGKFAGLSVKVRHNPLRPMMPLTFRLMSIAAIEIDIFAAYAAFRSRQGLRYAGAMPVRARDLIEFLGGWLDLGDHTHALLWDAIRYEDAVARLGVWYESSARDLEPSDIEPSDIEPSDLDPIDVASAPRVRGDILLQELQSDPRALADALFASVPDLGKVPLQPQYRCFWRAPDGDDAAVVVLDAFGYYLLSLLDGRRSIAVLARRLGGGPGMTGAVREALQMFATLGIVELPGPTEAR